MKKFCIIPMSARTGSTYLNAFIQRYNNKDSLNLGEFFNEYNLSYPRYNNQMISDMKIRNMLDNIPFEQRCDILNNMWEDHWTTNLYSLNKESKIKITNINKPLSGTTENIIKKHLKIILNSKQSFVFKIFPDTFFLHKEIFNNFFEQAKDNLRIILLERENIFDVYLSAVYSTHFKLYNFFAKIHSKTLTKDIICQKRTYMWIFNSIRNFNILKNQMEEHEYQTIYFDELWDDVKLLDKLQLNETFGNKTGFPCKLYSKYNQEEKLKFIVNIEEFWEYYYRGLEILKKEY